MSEAIERFGEAREVGAALRDVHGRGSWGEALAAMLPFLVIGLEMGLSPYLPQWEWYTQWLRLGGTVTVYAVLLIGLGVGWVKSFPRWSYPYLGLLLVLTRWLMGSSQGLRIFKGWSVWVPFWAMALIAVLLTRSWQPLRQLYHGVWHDWTRLSFGLYGFIPLALAAAFDDVSGTYETPYLAASTLALVAGAVAYVRSARTSQRTLALLIGMILSWVVATVGVATYWDGRLMPWMKEPGHWYVEARFMVIFWGVLPVLTFAPALLSLLRRSVEFIWAA